MKINVEFVGLLMISQILGKKKLEMDISAGTVKEVLDELTRRYGKRVRDAFCDPEGKFDLSIQTSLNGKSFVPVNQHLSPLIKEGDTVSFMLLVAGG
jgi:molybdopterin converting factor small subunit